MVFLITLFPAVPSSRISKAALHIAVATMLPVCAVASESELDLSEGMGRRLPPEKVFVQPPEIAKEFEPLATGSLKERLEALKQKVKRDFVFVQGGTFMMGDFGPVRTPEKLYYTGQRDNKPLHEVTLSSFSLSRFKVTYLEFDLFSEATGRKKVAQETWSKSDRKPLNPARSPWKDAQNYCRWLGSLTKLPIDLPTEAQWEYAARDRGKFNLFPTNSGEYEPGYNLSHYNQRVANETAQYYPVGIFPPTPLGLYDMAENGFEWMQDWYAEDYYENSPKEDPKGPPSGNEKVKRSRSSFSDRYVGLTIWRSKDNISPTHQRKLVGRNSVRCALHRS